MEYITRDLQHKTREILDKAMIAPVRIRRGGDFFELTKIKFNDLEKISQNFSQVKTQPINEPTYTVDSQEYEAPVPYTQRPGVYMATPVSKASSLEDLMSSGLIKRGA